MARTRGLLAVGEPFDYASVKEIAHPEPTTVPTVQIPAPDLRSYDALLRAVV